jgi:hypothetical protein
MALMVDTASRIEIGFPARPGRNRGKAYPHPTRHNDCSEKQTTASYSELDLHGGADRLEDHLRHTEKAHHEPIQFIQNNKAEKLMTISKAIGARSEKKKRKTERNGKLRNLT